MDPHDKEETAPAQEAMDAKALAVIAEDADNLPAERREEMERKAEALAARLTGDPDDREALRETLAVGETIESQASQQFGLLRTSLGAVMSRMKESGEASSIPGDLRKLREIMDEMNPFPAIEQLRSGRKAGFFSRLLGRAPGVGRILADIARRYESVQTQVDAIIQSLESGGDKLLENTLEIEERYKQLKLLQADVKLRAYQLKLVANKLDEAKAAATDEAVKGRLQKAEVKVMRRLQNLWVTAQAFSQFFVTMNVTLDNHENLRDAIKAMIGLTRPVLENGLALKIAQQEEKQIAEALEATQDYLGGLMESVAKESMDNAAYVAKVANQPLVRFQDLVRSYNLLVNRMEEAKNVEASMVESAKSNIAQLETMTRDLEQRSKAQEEARRLGRDLE